MSHEIMLNTILSLPVFFSLYLFVCLFVYLPSAYIHIHIVNPLPSFMRNDTFNANYDSIFSYSDRPLRATAP